MSLSTSWLELQTTKKTNTDVSDESYVLYLRWTETHSVVHSFWRVSQVSFFPKALLSLDERLRTSYRWTDSYFSGPNSTDVFRTWPDLAQLAPPSWVWQTLMEEWWSTPDQNPILVRIWRSYWKVVYTPSCEYTWSRLNDTSSLKESLQLWKEQGVRAVWFHVEPGHAEWIPPLISNGRDGNR